MTKRILLGNDLNGWTGFRATKEGFDARSVLYTEYQKLNFDSEWDALGLINQTGVFRSLSGSESSIDVWMPYPADLGFVPMLSIRRKTALNGGTIVGDEWWTMPGGGTDPYRNTFCTFSYSNGLWMCPEPVEGTQEVDDSINAPWYFEYIVWNLAIIEAVYATTTVDA